jgi:hypothetical protein
MERVLGTEEIISSGRNNIIACIETLRASIIILHHRATNWTRRTKALLAEREKKREGGGRLAMRRLRAGATQFCAPIGSTELLNHKHH